MMRKKNFQFAKKLLFFRTVQHTFERVELKEMRLFSQITSEFVN